MASLDDLVAQINAISTKVDTIINSNSNNSNVFYTQFNQVVQEKNLISFLMSQDKMTQQEAVAYTERMKNGERPWKS
jgi:hypothetical protein